MKYDLLQLDCRMKHSDGERIKSVLRGMGFTRTEEEQDLTSLGIVASSIRQEAIDKVYTKICEWSIRKIQEKQPTFVCGCLLPANAQKFQKQFDFLFFVKNIVKVSRMVRQYGITFAALFSLSKKAKVLIRMNRNHSMKNTVFL